MENLVTNRIVVGICGASGSIYGIRLLKVLLCQPWEVHLIISKAGKFVMAHEVGFKENTSFEQFLQKELHSQCQTNGEYFDVVEQKVQYPRAQLHNWVLSGHTDLK